MMLVLVAVMMLVMVFHMIVEICLQSMALLRLAIQKYSNNKCFAYL